MNEIVIRPSKISDSSVLANIHVSGWKSAYDGIVPRDFLDRMSVDERTIRFKKAISEKTEETYVVEGDGRIFGFITIGDCRDDDKGGGVGEIWGIYVDPEHWKKGYGRELAEYGEEILRMKGCNEIVLWVLAENQAARRFYEKLGYEADGESEQIEKLGNAKVVRYIKTI